MHGVIFASLRDFLTHERGEEAAQAVFAGEPPYLLSETYPDERLHVLLERAVERTGAAPDDLLEEFGIFTAQRTFTRLYPAFFAVSPDARQFLLTVETRIHELVRATIPRAAPPQLHVSELGEDGVEIVYSSPRRLCRLLRGLAEGTARHYDEQATMEEPECMLRGDPACRVEVRLAPREDVSGLR